MSAPRDPPAAVGPHASSNPSPAGPGGATPAEPEPGAAGTDAARAHFRRVDALLDAALDRDPATRAAFVDALADDDPALGAEVRALVRADAEAGAFLERPAVADPLQTRLERALAGRYVLHGRIGSGGMATVYLAEDTRHHRQVAVKVVHPELSAVLGPERFLKEIEVTAKLQHPHILPLFDSGGAEGLLYYVMPYVAGESLRARLLRETQLPVAEAVRLAREAADALAHGVVHRDVKPENVLLHAGHVVVADFGIALAVQSAGGARMTQTGLSLGTPQYMAPEQAAGDRTVDARADIHALGAVTYEMLPGEPPFTGANAQAIVARLITERARPLRAARPSVPAHVEAAVARALEKLPADRWDSAREFAEALEGRGSAPATPSRRPRGRPWVAAGALLAALAAGAVVGATWSTRRTPGPRPARLTLALPPDQRLVDVFGAPAVFAPDGRALAYVASAGAGQPSMLFYRPLDELTARPLPGTEGAIAPFFSPDGQWIGFLADDGALKKASVSAGGARVVAAAGPLWTGGAWGPNDVIVAGSEQGLWRIPASGGTPRLVTHVDTARGERFHAMPYIFPDGETVAFGTNRGADVEATTIAIVSLRSGRSAVLDVSGRNPVGFLDGQLIVGRQEGGAAALVAVPFDTRRWRATGAAVPLVTDVGFKLNGGAEASLARDGSLVYVRGSAERRLSLLDMRGAAAAGPLAPGLYVWPRFSPDGHRIAVELDRGPSNPTTNFADIWTYDLASGALSRVTSHTNAFAPAWLPDGRHIAYMVTAGRGLLTELWWVPFDASGPEARVYTVPAGYAFVSAPTFTPDGATAVVAVARRSGQRELWRLARTPSGTWQGAPFLQVAPYVGNPSLSPDGRWLAYDSRETGSYEVYVRPFPGPGGRVQVSTGGGVFPQWSPDGRRLYYLPGSDGGTLRVASLTTTPALDVTGRGDAVPGGGAEIPAEGGFAVRPDGNGFAVVRRAGERGREVVVALDWREELRRTLAAAGQR